MSENTLIEWATHTFNPWVGCEKISPACDNCYAETWARRAGAPELWSGERRRTTPANWAQPRKWNAASAKSGRRDRVFAASLADVFDNTVPDEWRSDLWKLISETSHLDWLLLTKRIGNAMRMLPAHWATWPYENVWLGATIANQEEADRDIPKLLATPARIRFLSCEPLLGLMDITQWLGDLEWASAEPTLSWVIIGGESGPKARQTVIGDIRILKEQCEAANVPVFVKQLGARPVDRLGNRFEISDRKGKVMEEWPKDLRVRQFPRPS